MRKEEQIITMDYTSYKLEPYTPKPGEKHCYGWLSPSGRFYYVPFGEHEEWAFQYVKQNWPLDYFEMIAAKSTHQASDVLLDAGWILLDSPSYSLAEVTRNETRTLTRRQRQFLHGYYAGLGRADLANAYFTKF